MSGFGQPYSYLDPDSQEQLSAIKRRQAYAQALLQQGGSDPGSAAYGGLANAGRSILGAFLANKADKSERDIVRSAQDKSTQDLVAFFGGGSQQSPPQPMTPPVSVSNAAGSGPQMDAGPVQPPPSGPQQVQAPNIGPPVPSPQQAPQSPMDRLLATHNPALIQQFAPQLFTHQMDINDKKVIPLSDREAMTLGLRPGGVYGREAATGNLTVIQPSDMKSKGAFEQGIKEHQLEQVLSPEALAQKERLERLSQGPAWAALNKPVSVGMGESLVNPKNGQVLYTGAPDADAVQTGIDFFKKFGTFPPNARSPALQQAIMAGIRKQGVSMDDAANSRIGFHAQQGAANSVAKTNAQTAVNEGTVNNSIQIVRNLLPTAASRGQFTDINSLVQNLGRRSNDKNAVLLKNGIDSISGEYARVMTGSTSGSPSSDASRHEAAQRILYGYNSGTIDAVMDQMQQEMAGRSGSQGAILNNLTGGKFGGTPVPGATVHGNNPGQSRFKIEQVH